MAIVHSLYRDSGVARIEDQTCTCCGQCVEICAAQVLKIEEGRVRPGGDSPFGCVACGHCMMVCPTGSISVTGRDLSPEDLLTLPPRENRATTDALANLMIARRSIRHFTEQEMAPGDLDRIVEIAAAAPMGIPPWDVGCVVVSGRAKVRELAAEIIKDYAGFLKLFRPWVLTCMRPFIRRETYEQYRDFIRPLAETYVKNYQAGRDVLFYGAPALLIFHHSPYADPADAAIACTYAMLAAESLGLGNTIIGGAPPILQRNKRLCQSLEIPDRNKPAMALIVGHPAVEFRRAIRRRFTGVSHIPNRQSRYA